MAEETPAAPAAEQTENGFQILYNRIRGWSLARKLSLAGVLVLSIALFAFIIIQARTADYQLLYGNLGEADAAATLEWLKGQNIPYQLTNNGRNIMIPATNVHEARLSLAAVGLPQGGGVGFEIFDKQSFALTDFVQKVNYGRALQGELARTIASLGPVENARVHLVLPEKRLFKNQQKPATASVILKLAAGRRLADSQVEGIVHLVSSSIEGLSPDNVTIIDQNGNVLSKRGDKGMVGNLSPDMLEYQLQVESRLEERAQDLLDRAIGPKSSLVRVTASLDFSQTEKTEEMFDPEEPVIRSEQMSEERSGSEIVGGVPGVQSNLEGNTTQSAAATPPSSRSQRTTNYEISKVVSRTVNPVGTVQKISVSVLVADKFVPAEGDQPERTEQRSEEELLTLENMIASALGLDKTRGDKIEVTSMPFTDVYPAEETGDLKAPALTQYLPIIKYVLLFLAAGLVYLFLIRPMIKTLRDDVTEHFKTVREMEEEELRKRAAKEDEELQALMRDPVMRVRRSVEENPVFTAHVLKNWLQERS